MKRVYWLILCVALLNIILSCALYGKHQALDPNAAKMCFGSTQCDLVLKSSYATVWGVPQALIGVVAFTALALVAWLCIVFDRAERVLLLFLLGGGLYALRMLYLQAFVIGAFCPYCVTIDISTILVCALLLYMNKRRNGHVFAHKARSV
ncbi:MAG: vitamin K epoxide reductase family protein [Nanoarchaeota archaeon]